MGVPSFYRWLVQKYPNVVVPAIDQGRLSDAIDTSQPNPNGLEFDNLYLDVNGIIHPCFHPEDILFPPTTFHEVFQNVFEYIDRIFSIVRPRKLLYMAIDGVAPRAKMNHQRSRRYRTAKDAEIAEAEEERLRREFKLQGKEVLPKIESEVSDSNIITPGTEFMDKLSQALQFYIRSRLNNDPGWKKIKVILSDASVPGEGEHKIMTFIRLQRNLQGYDPNTRHCLYGLDADLIMLALATHEVHFSILREDLLLEEKRPSCIQTLGAILTGMSDSGSLGSSGTSCKAQAINRATRLSKRPYQFLNIWTLREYLELDMKISDPPFAIDFERIVDDFILFCFFPGNDFLPHMPSLEIREGCIDLMMKVYRDEFKKRRGYLVDMQRVHDKKHTYVDLKRIEKFILSVGAFEERIFMKRLNLRERMIKRLLRENSEVVDDVNGFEEGMFSQVPKGKSDLNYKNNTCRKPDVNTNTISVLAENTKELKEKLKCFISEKSDLFKQGALDRDKIKLGMVGWRERYYKEKFSAESPKDIENIRKQIVEKYAEGLCWVLQYYFLGLCSWTWYYPYHYGPFASDFKGLAKVNVTFKMGAPFKPFDQLMAVLPPRSVKAVPKAYWKLMTSEQSNIIDFYPSDFEVDMNGKRYLGQVIVKLPFIEEERLLAETRRLENELKEEEAKRNSKGGDIMFVMKSHDLSLQILSLYNKHVPKKEAMAREPINVFTSGGLNGFVRVCSEDFGSANCGLYVKGMGGIVEDRVLCVHYECPDPHTHIPRLHENVTMPEKTITEDDIEPTQLWHGYASSKPSYSRQQIKEANPRTSSNITSAKDKWRGVGAGFSAGRGKTHTESMHYTSSANFGSSTGIRTPNIGKSTSLNCNWNTEPCRGASSGQYSGRGNSYPNPPDSRPSGNSSSRTPRVYTRRSSSLYSKRNYESSRQNHAANSVMVPSLGASPAGQVWVVARSNQGICNVNGSSTSSNSAQASQYSESSQQAGNDAFLSSRNVSNGNWNHAWRRD